jgi:type III secretion protein Q
MTAALQLRQMSVARMATQNTLYQGGLHIAFRWLGRDWTCSLRHVRTVPRREVRIVADWGGAEAVLLADLPWLASSTQALLHVSDVSALPIQLQLALLETAFDEIADQIEAASKKPLRLKSLQLVTDRPGTEVDLQEKEGIAWKAECEGQAFEGELVLDSTAMIFASTAARSREHDERERSSLPILPITMQFVIGTTTIPLSAFSSIQVRDVIVLDESWLHQQETLTVMVVNNAVFRARISGTQLVVTEGLTNIMDESYDENEFAAHDIVSELPVKLTFDLGERVLPLGELQMVAPGYVFDLGRDLRQGVIIRANGMRIGEGELIDIEGRTGVAVLSITGQLE